MSELPYGEIERDLTDLCHKRVSDAMLSVMQLGDTPGQKLMIAIAGASAALAGMSGAFDAYSGSPKPTDPLDGAELVIKMLRKHAKP